MYVIDTYAFLEWFVHGSSSYRGYFEEIEKKGAYTTELVLLEIYHIVLHREDREKANLIYKIISGFTEIIPLNDDRIKKTAEKRSEMLKKGKKLSYTDCLNLVVAEELKVKVLTGDEEFKNLPRVEFVK